MGDVVMQIQTPRLEERRIEKDRLVLRRSNRRDLGSPDEALKSADAALSEVGPFPPDALGAMGRSPGHRG